MKWFTLGIGMALLFACLANAQTTTIITMRDACDPASFNIALGPGHCVPGQHGNTLFADFIGELQSDQNAGAWRFNPMLNATAGTFKLVRLDLTAGDQTVLEKICIFSSHPRRVLPPFSTVIMPLSEGLGSSPFADSIQSFNLRRFYVVGAMETHAAGAERFPTPITILRMRCADVYSTVGALRCRALATIIGPIIA